MPRSRVLARSSGQSAQSAGHGRVGASSTPEGTKDHVQRAHQNMETEGDIGLECNVKLRKLLSAHKSHVREISLFTGAIPNPVRNSQTSRFVLVPGQNPKRSSRGDSVVLRLQSMRMADVWWCRSRTGIGYLKRVLFSVVNGKQQRRVRAEDRLN